jgi:D-alanyl-D-alanine carboxypeptidase
MKKWGFLLLLLLCLCLTFVIFEPSFESKVNIQEFKYENDIVEDGNTSENIKIEITEEQIYQGNLLLINSEYPVHPDSIKTDIINLFNHNELTKGYGLLDSNIYLSKDIAQKFSQMVVDAAEKKGINNFMITSGFREFEEQRALYQDKGAEYALPEGHSEHNLGLALDVGSTETTMYEASEAEWIKENSWEYGFILRYPEDKVDVTGIAYEPWHIRYVGLPHSAIMKEKNYALEEYLDYLKKIKTVSAEFEGQKYIISYYPFKENMTINIPENREYEISGNNMDGVIVTLFPKSYNNLEDKK